MHLARLASPALDDIVFDENLPDAAASAPGLVVGLVAYPRAERFARLASAYEDFDDLESVVGLLNVLLHERGSDLRYVVVDDALVPERIALGSAPALLSAVADGLLVVA